MDDIQCKYSKIENMPAGITMENAKLVQLDDSFTFQSHFTFLSSMYPVPKVINGMLTHCAEQTHWLKIARLTGYPEKEM